VLVALVAAVGTWLTTNYRLAVQLRAEAERLATQLTSEERRQHAALKAEADRLDQRMSHERRLVDLEHARRLFDDCAAAFESARVTARELAAYLHLEHPGRMQLTNPSPANRDATLRVANELHRLELRFTPDHRAIETFRLVTQHMDKRRSTLIAVREARFAAQMTDAQNEASIVHARAALAAFDDFITAARAEIGVLQAAASTPALPA